MLSRGDELAVNGATARWDDLNPTLVRRIETDEHPLKLFSGAAPCYIIPIRHAFAQELLGLSDAQEPLFKMNESAAVARENVYYRKPKRAFAVPARILWWVSGGDPTGGMRAMSWLDAIVRDEPRTLYSKYGDRGVLSLSQIAEMSTMSGVEEHPMTSALLFSHTEVFPYPVGLEQTRGLHPESAREAYFVSVNEVGESVAEAFYRAGTRQDEGTAV